jgi:hypothetical protein
MQPFQLTRKQLNDYRTGMQANAATFIDRHQDEYLCDDGLFDRTVGHLVNVWGVPLFMAGRLVHLAMTERLPKGATLVGVDMASSPDQCVLRDFRIGKSIPVPGRFLPHHLQQTPGNPPTR